MLAQLFKGKRSYLKDNFNKKCCTIHQWEKYLEDNITHPWINWSMQHICGRVKEPLTFKKIRPTSSE